MDFWVSIGVAVLLRLLKNQKDSEKYADAVAKLFVAMENAVRASPILTAAVEKQEDKVGI